MRHNDPKLVCYCGKNNRWVPSYWTHCGQTRMINEPGKKALRVVSDWIEIYNILVNTNTAVPSYLEARVEKVRRRRVRYARRRLARKRKLNQCWAPKTKKHKSRMAPPPHEPTKVRFDVAQVQEFIAYVEDCEERSKHWRAIQANLDLPRPDPISE